MEKLAGLSDELSPATASTPIDDAATLPEVIYSPEGPRGLGAAAWLEMGQELWRSRELAWRLFLRDLSARYRQSALGYVWAVMPTLVTVATFMWLGRARVLPPVETELPYPLFVLLGVTVWQLFAGGLTGATQSLVSAGSLISKINFPRETLVLAAFGQSLLEFAIRLVLVAIAFVLYQAVPAWTVILVPLAMLPLCLLTLGLGFILSLVNGVVRDTGPMVNLALTLGMFLTPVIYSMPSGPSGSAQPWLLALNPVSPFVIAARDLTIRGYLTQPESYAMSCCLGLGVFLAAWRLFHLTESSIAERV